uniref:dolichyl-P-Glc:Man9GlcNAc2-PP-dolichol alpha-1,3-glucosyltransferase n=1 Tax=Anopheles dirus TaxID=7168 RepID=A0A182NUR9_9DIPT
MSGYTEEYIQQKLTEKLEATHVRHWQEVTVNLPIADWYRNTTDNDLLYWGLDYPPLTAYHSYLVGAWARRWHNESFVALHASRGISTEEHKQFMRNTVLLVDAVLYIPVLLYATNAIRKRLGSEKTMSTEAEWLYPAVAVLFPGQILIDNGHFQYNNVSLALCALAVVSIVNKRSLDAVGQLVHRIFPVARGVFEDKVSNVWCVVNVFVKLKNFPNTTMALICLLCTLLAVLPSGLHVLLQKIPSPRSFLYSLVVTALGFFLFSFQVHEKSILLAALPVTLLLPLEPFASCWFLQLASFSMLPLLHKDGLTGPYLGLTLIVLTLLRTEVVDESDGCGGKFRVVVVSTQFQGKPLLQRHRLVNAALEEELKTIHAFSQKTYTPEQWAGEMNQFAVSAPGKVILHGEHSVVYGHPAIAGSVGLRTYLNYTALEQQPPGASDGPVVIVEFRSIPFTATLSLESFDAFVREVDCCVSLQPDAFLEQLRTPGPFPFARFVRDPSAALTDPSSKERMSLGSTLYIMNRVLRAEGVRSIEAACFGAGGFRLSLHSEMSIGAGLGSSASYGVCLAAGTYQLSRILKRELTASSPTVMSPELAKKVSQWAFDSEIIMHVKPSGIDNEIATNGGLVRFRRGIGVDKVVGLRRPLHVLIVDTGVSRSTAKLVASTAKRLELFPRTIGPVLESMGGLVEEAIDLFESDDEPDTVYDRLSTLVSVNNNLLRSLGASHASLEQIFAISERYGFASKLTGAGGGGCAFVLLPAGFRELDSYAQLVDALTEAGFRSIETTVGVGAGVTLTNPESFK